MPTIGRYEINRELGRGGMASVFEANDPRFGRSVAVKVLPREMLFDPAFRARFDREARTVAMLEHSGIVPVHDYGAQDGQPFIVMRYMPCGSLAARLKNGPLQLRAMADIFARIGPAIDYAHAQGVVHRDLKPANILFDNAGEAYIADFGIAKISESSATPGLTQGVIGTPAYMSPEQWEGKTVDGRTDLYALGIILYESLAGRLPYVADSLTGFMKAHLFDPVPAILNAAPSFAAPLQQVVQRALAKRPDQRYPNAVAMAADLQAIADGRMVAAATQVWPIGMPAPGVAATPVTPPAPPPSIEVTGPHGMVPPEAQPANPINVPPPGGLPPNAYPAPPSYPLASGPSLGAPPARKSRTGLFIAIGIGVAALAAVVCVCASLSGPIMEGIRAAGATSTPVRATAVVARPSDTPAPRPSVTSAPTGVATAAATARPTATAVPARTATPTGTRLAAATPTGRATVVATPVAGPINLTGRDATAIGKALEALKIDDRLAVAPVSGDLVHQPGAKKVTWLRPDTWVKDFVAEVEFGNPFGASEGPFDYGFFFRVDDDAQSHYRFVIKSTGAWELRLIENDNANSPVTSSGTVSNLSTGRGAYNKVALYAYGNRGTFWVNGVWSGAVFDLAKWTEPGDVAIMTGMFDDDHKAGAITKYINCRVWDIGQ